jgi:hypothetical protein
MKIYQKIHDAKNEIGKVAKNAKNPHFKNTYADLNALIEAVEPILLEKGLVLLQPIKEGRVFTIIADVESGECLESFIDLPTTGTPQSMGSAITYYRRYTLQSLLSLQAVDDDGQAASVKTNVPIQLDPTSALNVISKATSLEDLKARWESLSNQERALVVVSAKKEEIKANFTKK